MILIQREFTVPAARREEFERRSREGVWPAFMHFGVPMVAFGSWAFGGPSDALVTHTIYEDLSHWGATRPETGLYHHDPALAAEIQPYADALAQFANSELSAFARPFELIDAALRTPAARRIAGERLPDPPPTFGRGSVISERTLSLHDGAREEFVRLSTEQVWPWLEASGGRGIAMGSDLMGNSSEITTWFAFPTIGEWHRFTRPTTAGAPPAVVNAYRERQKLVRHQRGRLLLIGTDWGTRLPRE